MEHREIDLLARNKNKFQLNVDQMAAFLKGGNFRWKKNIDLIKNIKQRSYQIINRPQRTLNAPSTDTQEASGEGGNIIGEGEFT